MNVTTNLENGKGKRVCVAEGSKKKKKILKMRSD
jgi:hypothetical protein